MNTSYDHNYLDLPADIQSMANKVRRYRKDDVVSHGLNLVWSDLREDSEIRGFDDTQRKVIREYGPKIILLSLATGNNYRTNTINEVHFHNLCNHYLALPESIEDEKFINEEAQKIINILEQEDWLQKQHLSLDTIRHSCLHISMARLIGSQSKGNKANPWEMRTDYGLLSRLDEEFKGVVTTKCQNAFELNLLQLYRASFCLYVMANDPAKKGRIDFKNFKAEESTLKTLKISKEDIEALAKHLSFSEESLRDNWFNNVKATHPIHQKHQPVPLSKKPLICLKESNPKHYILPSPRSFTRSLRAIIYGNILQNSQFSALGDIIETHIQNSLGNIFGSDNVSKIDHAGKKADFFLRLKKLNFIIETKTMIAGIEAKSVMTPDHICDIWNRLYGASLQCSESIKRLATPDKINIPVVLIADHMTAEAMPFLIFAHRSGLLKKLRIEGIQYLSWNSLEDLLSKISIEQFEKTLIDNYEKLSKAEVADLLTLQFKPSEPAHSYEHLSEYKSQLLI